MKAVGPPDAPQARRPVRLTDMIFVFRVEAHEIRARDQYFLDRPELKFRVAKKDLETAEVMEAAVRFLEKLQPVFGQVLELIKGAEAGAVTKVERGGRDGGKRKGAVR